MSEQFSDSRQPTAVFLYGPSGSGKSTVGWILAEKLNIPFVDLDIEIENQCGTGIPEIFAAEGESGFRKREHAALERVLVHDEQMIALGGGALTVPENRALAESAGRVVMLDAPAEILLSRLQDDSIERPLLVGNAKVQIHSLLEKRKDHYASFANRVDTIGRTPEDVSWEIQIELGMFHLRGMASKKYAGYDVRVRAGVLDFIGGMLKSRGLNGPIAVVTDENVGAVYLHRVTESLTNSGFVASGITIPAGEAHKTLETVSQLWDGFSSAKIERTSTIVALGGGVIGDLTGFAAATWLRGVPWVVVPTSLLAMVDASLGGKTGADLPQGKNLIGAFHPPRLVLADPNVLTTLPKIELVNGMAEVIKHGVITDPRLLEMSIDLPGLSPPFLSGMLRKNLEGLVSRAMAVKVGIIEKDPYEKGIRAALNLGHTVGHGVELASEFQIRHGEAVSMGMVAEARMAERIGLAEPGFSDEIAAILQAVGLPIEIPPNLDRSLIREVMMRDKKKAGGIVRFALPAAIGDVRTGVEIDNWVIG